MDSNHEHPHVNRDVTNLLSDTDVAEPRESNQWVSGPSCLTKFKKYNLCDLADAWIGLEEQPGPTTPTLTRETRDEFLRAVFKGWATKGGGASIPVPGLARKKLKDISVNAGTWKETLPASDKQTSDKAPANSSRKRKRGEEDEPRPTPAKEKRLAARQQGQEAVISVSIDQSKGTINWEYRDSISQLATSEFVDYGDETEISVKSQSVAQFDQHENERIEEYNRPYGRSADSNDDDACGIGTQWHVLAGL
ncbi:hypothetical protein NM208_g7124 [Fusarium decemcellulare]|uniref:Uncharacterized protein n=2 Tax=Fusarium decemcellulare TaxID=57161 RepID=A0ACC1SAI3_9HYPO|nr:hypothetical protein NM208_g11363 [Fusarium decemcellulare]KAJ3535454.1 hypothetical protein NM208_g7124 [Fusarium decemcellulare]